MNPKNVIKYLLFVASCLVIFGALIIYSSTDSILMFKNHLGKVLLAIGVFGAFAFIPYDYYKKYSKYFLLFIVLLLIFTKLFGVEKNGAKRWIDLWFIAFQPSELAKVILIMHLSVFIERKGELIKSFSKGLKFALIWIALISGLVIIQPNVSTSMIIVMISFTLLYVGGASFRHIMATVITLVGSAAVAVFAFYPHAVARIKAFLFDEHFQVTQAKIALGSGGLTGLGLGNSRQSEMYVPEPYGDFIFSILGEEAGFVGTLFVVGSYLLIFLMGLIIAKKANDTFGQLFAFGISFMIILSAFTHVCVVTGLLPTTGITLPFISYGGTSLLIFAMCLGILTNIAIKNRTVEELKVQTFG